ncbi:uncharacterized protein M437DRAFT_70148 [Aureobasidium melanogenum CBS 110374]|uniref:Uncharacterized protein n=1 Tax=Aureobasidium melanogenum (strain CBS 110374) TaxID=1043003 RepID=A0A074VKL9_AURM1|nr:uncharacterized protein M437DRAFT_70148 [Aureobasidium melanogenum CBS 110374]KEQ58172.1 hypothetical protein M437DRAFT_70148 [Aureobasidium melanogenum CBS 110374]
MQITLPKWKESVYSANHECREPTSEDSLAPRSQDSTQPDGELDCDSWADHGCGEVERKHEAKCVGLHDFEYIQVHDAESVRVHDWCDGEEAPEVQVSGWYSEKVKNVVRYGLPQKWMYDWSIGAAALDDGD